MPPSIFTSLLFQELIEKSAEFGQGTGALFGGWWSEASKLLWEYFPDMEPYPIPPGLDKNTCTIKGDVVVTEAVAFKVPGKIRQIRAALVSTNATSPKVRNRVVVVVVVLVVVVVIVVIVVSSSGSSNSSSSSWNSGSG